MTARKEVLTIHDAKVFLTERGVINKTFKDLIRSHTEELLEVALNLESMIDPDVKRDVVQNVEYFLHQLHKDEVINQWDVVCDGRNNTTEMSKDGVTNFYVKYKQWNCLKSTVLEYTIERKPRAKKKTKGRVIL